MINNYLSRNLRKCNGFSIKEDTKEKVQNNKSTSDEKEKEINSTLEFINEVTEEIKERKGESSFALKMILRWIDSAGTYFRG